jgi:hypothetical protein
MTWYRLRRALDEQRADMLRFVGKAYGMGAIEEAWREFLLDENAEFDPESLHLDVFMPWFYHFWSPNPLDTGVRDKALHEVIPTAEYLRRKKSLPPLLREYLQSCLEAPLSVFEVRKAEAGEGLLLGDLFTREEHRVIERSASVAMDEGDLVFGQVARAGGVALLEACQAFVIPPIWKVEAVKFRDSRFAGALRVPPGDLRARDIDLLALYREIHRALFERKLPAVQNTDGEPFSLRRVAFDIASAQEAFEALKHLALDEADADLLRDAERDAAGRLVKVRFSWLKRGNAQNSAWENTILGTIEIEGTRLYVDVNSEKREEAIRAVVAEALGERARYRATEIQSLEKLLAEPPGAPRTSDETAALLERPEVKAKIAEMMAKHYERWMDEKIPALGGRTPREAVRDPSGREAVAALLRQIERDGERMRPPLDPAIPRRLREQLGFL